MAYNVAHKTSDPESFKKLSIEAFRGINLSVNPSQISDNESPDVLNMISDDKGALDKILGTVALFESVGTGKITCLVEYVGNSYVFGFGNNLYKLTLSTGAYTSIYTGMSGNDVSAVTFDGKLYLLDGAKYLVYNGTSVTEVVGYIPIITVSTDPTTGEGTANEGLNLISAGFTQWFDGDAAATSYKLAYTNLDLTAITVTVGGVTVVENTGFTVNRTTGVIDFTTGTTPHGAPAAGTNNVVITAYKTNSTNANKIKQCKLIYVWGGVNNSRLWLSGNTNYPNVDFRSGLVSGASDGTYFPIEGETKIGDKAYAIKGYASLYSSQIVIKEDSIYVRDEEVTDAGDYQTTVAILNNGIGCVSSGSIQTLFDFPTFLSKHGVYQVVSVDTQNENNVRHISNKIDRNSGLTDALTVLGLLEDGILSSTVSADYMEKYWLIFPATGKCWVYDYRYLSANGVGEWYLLDGIVSSKAEVLNDRLYFGHNTGGYVFKLKDKSDAAPYSHTTIVASANVNTAISCRWTSKIFDFGTITNFKLLRSMTESLKPSASSMVSIYTRSDKNATWVLLDSVEFKYLTYSGFSYSGFMYGGNPFPRSVPQRVQDKRITYYQIRLSNNEALSSMGFQSISFVYQIKGEIR